MYLNKIAQPLSPPTSPRMSGNERKRTDSFWPTTQAQQLPSYGGSIKPGQAFSAQYANTPYQSSGESVVGPVHHPEWPTSSQDGSNTVPPLSRPTQNQHLLGSGTGQNVPIAEKPGAQAVSYIGGKVGRMSPGQPAKTFPGEDEGSDHEDFSDDEEMELEGDGTKQEGDRPPMTAAEIRNQKRKMKRFR